MNTQKENKLLKIHLKEDFEFLRKQAPDFDLAVLRDTKRKKEITEAIKKMRKIMKENNGIGLGANQVGMNWRMFILSDKEKFYAIFNPQIIKFSKETEDGEEGCLSVDGVIGKVSRYKKIVLLGFNKNGKKVKIKAWGILARAIQHEIDHLNGILFIDKTKQLYKVANIK